MALAAETLYTLQLLHLTCITLADADVLSLCHLMAEVNYLAQQLGVRGERDVLLLNGGVDEGRLVLVSLPHTPVPAIALVLLLAASIFNGKVYTDAQIYRFYTTKLQNIVDITKLEMSYFVNDQIFNFNLRDDYIDTKWLRFNVFNFGLH